MDATAVEIEQNRQGMMARMERELQEGIAKGWYCPDCHSPRKQNRWFYTPNGEIGNLIRCTNDTFHTKPKAQKARKKQMSRQDWFIVVILLMLSNAAMFDGKHGWGVGLMIVATLIVILVDGFGIKL
jgi:hypothetical protein